VSQTFYFYCFTETSSVTPPTKVLEPEKPTGNPEIKSEKVSLEKPKKGI
jgi:hypothetical protein